VVSAMPKWVSIRLTIKVNYVKEDEAAGTERDNKQSDGEKKEGDAQKEEGKN